MRSSGGQQRGLQGEGKVVQAAPTYGVNGRLRSIARPPSEVIASAEVEAAIRCLVITAAIPTPIWCRRKAAFFGQMGQAVCGRGHRRSRVPFRRARAGRSNGPLAGRRGLANCAAR